MSAQLNAYYICFSDNYGCNIYFFIWVKIGSRLHGKHLRIDRPISLRIVMYGDMAILIRKIIPFRGGHGDDRIVLQDVSGSYKNAFPDMKSGANGNITIWQ